MGARITAQLYEAEEIDRNEACYLLTFCSSPSPAFLSSYVILTAFSGQIHPGFVFGVLYGSNFLTGFLFRLVFRRFRLHRHTAHRTHSVEKKEMSKQTSKGNLLDTSIMNGFEIITQLGGYIILFSILSGLLMDLHPFGSASPLALSCREALLCCFRRNAWFIPLRFPLLMPDHIPVRQLLPLAALLPEHPAGRAHFCSEQRYCSSLSGILQSCCISLLHRLMQSS